MPCMKLLLTSGGVTNGSIRDALVGLLGKPIEESAALCIPTAQWGHPMCGPDLVRSFVTDRSPATMTGLGWRSVGLLELTALPTVARDRWVPWVEEADVLLVDGGEATYLAHWVRSSGLGDLLPGLTDTVWVFPHVGLFPTNTMEAAEEWATGLGNPAYALDEQSAVLVDGDRVEVVSEGEWRRFP